jgi:dynein heavy chain
MRTQQKAPTTTHAHNLRPGTLRHHPLTARLLPLAAFAGFDKKFASDPSLFKEFIDSPDPHLALNKLPSAFCSEMTDFQKLLILRTLRLDKLVPAVSKFVADELGQKYIEPPPFDLEGTFRDSTPTSPLIFVLSPGVDPMLSLLKFAETKGRKVDSISLGQGQGPHAERMILDGCKEGYWIVLQNCHLYVSWMTTLERLVEEFDPKTIGANFRLWLTSYPSPAFPVLILQNGVKMTNEPPKGLRANMLQSYMADPISDQAFFEQEATVHKKTEVWRKMLFGLCFLHAFVQERRKYGPLGWNIPYEFNESDLRISVRQLQMFIDKYEETPLPALNYLTAECNYGGRVTDDKDRRLLLTVVKSVYCEGCLGDQYALSASGEYRVPGEELKSYDSILEYIKQWPQVPKPEVFGLHENADITKDLGESDLLLKTVLVTQSSDGGGGGGGGGKSADELVVEMSKDILNKLPSNFDLEVAEKRYPVLYSESMNTVVCQEMVRYNKLLSKVRTSLQNLQKAIKGLVVMSSDLEELAKNMFDNQLPVMWAKVSYPSLKPLSSYVAELLDRLAFFQSWMDDGQPLVFQMPSFFFVQAFMTGCMQNYARKYTVPIDTIDFDFEFLAKEPDAKPADGVITTGLFLEGARMDEDTMLMAESLPKTLFSPMTVILLLPSKVSELSEYQHYECPVYRTTERRGVLATTGHSSNFVMFIRLPTDQPEEHWIARGVALVNSLSS